MSNSSVWIQQLAIAAREKIERFGYTLFVMVPKNVDVATQWDHLVSDNIVGEVVGEIKELRQCSTCSETLRLFGSLAYYSHADGRMRSLYFDPDAVTDPEWKPALKLMADYLESRPVQRISTIGKYATYILALPNWYMKSLENHRASHSGMHLCVDPWKDAYGARTVSKTGKRNSGIKRLIELTSLISKEGLEMVSRLFGEGVISHRGQSATDLTAFARIHLTTQQIEDDESRVRIMNIVWQQAARTPELYKFLSTAMAKFLREITQRLDAGVPYDPVVLTELWDNLTVGQMTQRKPWDQIRKDVLKVIEEKGFSDSLLMQEANLDDLPVLWNGPEVNWSIYDELMANHKQLTFAEHVAGVKAQEFGNLQDCMVLNLDMGEVFNQVLPYALGLNIDLQRISFRPSRWVKLKRTPEGFPKPVWRWDKDGDRFPLAHVVEDRMMNVDQLDTRSVGQVTRIDSITTTALADKNYPDTTHPALIILLSGAKCMAPPPVVLNNHTLIGELQPYHNVLEQYGNSTSAVRSNDPATGIMIPYRSTAARNTRLFVKLNKEGREFYGASVLLINTDLAGYGTPLSRQYEVLQPF